MVIIGIDPHKSANTARAVQAGSNKVLASMQVGASFSEYRRLLRWAASLKDQR